MLYVMGITDGKLLYCHGVAERNKDKKISSLEYNNRTVYDWFNNNFTDDFGSPDLNLPPITFDDRPRQHKISHYAPDLPPDNISVASENYFGTLTTPSDSPDLLTYDDHNTLHVMKMDVPFLGRVHRWYGCWKNDRKMCYKKTSFYCSTCSDKITKYYYYHDFYRINSKTRT